MRKLSPDWFMEGMLDFEYKKYVLLAYLQSVGKEFADYKLYPSFSDLIFHYRNLQEFKENKQKLTDYFPKEIDVEAFKSLKLKYKPKDAEGGDLSEIESIIDFSLPQINGFLQDGKRIYTQIDANISIEPIGITPLYKQEGYILLNLNLTSSVKAYSYKILFLENAEANYYGISMNFLETFTKSIVNTYENMKLSLTKLRKELPNPATYLVFSNKSFPEESAVLPVTKRKMLALMRKP